MNIAEMGKKIKVWLEGWFLGLVIGLVALGSFGLGRLSKIEEMREPVEMVTVAAESQAKPADPQKTGEQSYVASKNGTKYYLSTCSAANRIKPENKVYFKTKAEAEARGLTPAANCPGL